jgi:hypothetical protein
MQIMSERDAGTPLSLKRDAALPGWAIPAGVLAVLLLVRGILAFWTRQQGFVEYNADGFSRVIRGYEWLQAPRWEVELWLPLHFWLYGSLFWVWDELFTASRALNLLLGIAVIIGIYLIGQMLVDWRSGAIGAGLAAVFPYEVWLSISGMSEPLYHALMVWTVVGLVHWWINDRRWALIGASLTLAAATAVRYEAWFFVTMFMLVLLAGAIVRRERRDALPHIAGAAIISIAFILVWVQQNWSVHGDPLAFARGTEEAKLAEDPGNMETTLLERLTYFPEIAFSTAPGIILLGAVGSTVVLAFGWRRWWPVLALIWGQAMLMVGVTSMFASQGPGAERYLLSNTVLLCVPIAGALVYAIDRWGRSGLTIAAGCLIVLLASFLPDLTSPPVHYPAADTREMAGAIKSHLHEQESNRVIVLLPPIPDERFNEGYALRVLSGDANRVEITDEPSRLYEAVQAGEVSRWIMDSALDTREPPAERRWSSGAYVAGSPPPLALVESPATPVTPGSQIPVRASGFLPEEPVSTWWTGPDESVYAGSEFSADGEGHIKDTETTLPDSASEGTWTLTLAGTESQRQAFLRVEVRE